MGTGSNRTEDVSGNSLPVNSKKYWDFRFKSDWEEKLGKEQTRYFAELACSMLPEWFLRDVQKNEYSICDVGCAQGDALSVLSKIFYSSKLYGEDFSDIAVEKARENHPQFTFDVADILDESHSGKYDVIYCSNVLEHFENPRGVWSRLIDRSGNYTVVMIPFREDFEIEEHNVVFDTCDIPVLLNGSQLVYAQSVLCGSEHYMREQILLIYSKNPGVRGLSSLKDLVENVCNRELSQTQKDWQRLNDELYLVKGELSQTQKDWQRLNDELYLVKGELSQIQKDWQRLNDELHLAKGELSQTQKDWQRLNDELFLANTQKKDWEAQKQSAETELRQVRAELGELRDERLAVSARNEDIERAKEILFSLQSSNAYKWSLYLRRIKDQLISGPWAEKKDFIKYTLGKLKLGKRPCKDLSSFDLLVKTQALLSAGGADSSLTSAGPGRKDGAQIFIFAGIPYYDIGAGQRCSQLAKTFSQMGYRVYYFYAYDSSESVKFDVFIPAMVHKYIDDASVEDVLGIVEDNAVFIFEAPYVKFVPYLDKARQVGIKTLYEHIDNWETSLGSLLYDPQSFRAFLDRSDCLVATSVELVKQLEAYGAKGVAYAPNAVDVNLFEPRYKMERPSDLVSGRQKTLLYFGSLWGEWFDWELVRTVAKACPDSAFNIIGDYSGIPDIVKSLPPNVVFLGLKKQTELPAYLAYSDIAMLPFKNCEIGKYVSPLKIFEYIAMNKKVLATPLPDIIDYPNTVCSGDAGEWIAVVKGDVETEDPASFIGNNNWHSRCNVILDLCGVELYPAHARKDKISIIVLNYNNMSVIFRCVDSLIKHSPRYQYEIVVVDNNSQDGSYEKLREVYGNRIVLVRNDKNGCSSGRNLGVERSSGDILVFLDSDQWIIGGRWLDCAMALISKHPGIGALSWAAGWFAPGTVTGSIVDYFPNRAMRPDQFYRDDVAYLGTGGMVMKRSVFDSTEGFDTEYDPTCFEDTDLSFQINDLGLKTVYCPHMDIMHLPHQTTKSGEESHLRLINKNGDYFIRKWKDRNPDLLDRAWEYYPG